MGHSGYELFSCSWGTQSFRAAIILINHYGLRQADGKHNFGLHFSWWSWVMGTERPDYMAKATGDALANRRPFLPADKPCQRLDSWPPSMRPPVQQTAER